MRFRLISSAKLNSEDVHNMRKRIATPAPATVRARSEGSLHLECAATVEVTPEDKDFPIEFAPLGPKL
jgi:hypothetical protein